MVSPLNSAVDLTRRIEDPDSARIFDSLYSTGERNFVRVYPADDRQGAALVAFARDRGRHRLFVLDDGYGGYSVLIGDAGERAARRLGVDVVGRASWSPTARSYRRLARRIAAAGTDAVLLAGGLQNNGGQLLRTCTRSSDRPSTCSRPTGSARRRTSSRRRAAPRATSSSLLRGCRSIGSRRPGPGSSGASRGPSPAWRSTSRASTRPRPRR